jgi:hypothetical protein
MDQKEYGEFLPAKFSYQYFPESGAANYFTASDEDGRNLGGHMFNPESHDAFGKEIVGTKETRQTSEIPDHIDQVEPEEMSGVPFFDKDYDRRFAFVKPELEFYKRYGIAPPNKHFLRRVRYLYACANAGVFEKAKCVQCAADLVVAQNKNYQERKLYCRDCYLKHLEVNG